ncbi:hypothetical protein BaRGS_00003204 [Batillaria attramentaria]|uniref:Secreted protein n=1 Tax=Batillaria attramentaria TaxID=370345 RepID=A0ABD0M0L4_9CAEN
MPTTAAFIFCTAFFKLPAQPDSQTFLVLDLTAKATHNTHSPLRKLSHVNIATSTAISGRGNVYLWWDPQLISFSEETPRTVIANNIKVDSRHKDRLVTRIRTLLGRPCDVMLPCATRNTTFFTMYCCLCGTSEKAGHRVAGRC